MSPSGYGIALEAIRWAKGRRAAISGSALARWRAPIEVIVFRAP